jgi:hypothetical protein
MRMRLVPQYSLGPSIEFMRESARSEQTQLPRDTYQEWLKSQKEEPLGKGRGEKVSENIFEVWMAKRVDRRTKKASSKVMRKRYPSG